MLRRSDLRSQIPTAESPHALPSGAEWRAYAVALRYEKGAAQAVPVMIVPAGHSRKTVARLGGNQQVAGATHVESLP
jgi:hypothetical protein